MRLSSINGKVRRQLGSVTRNKQVKRQNQRLSSGRKGNAGENERNEVNALRAGRKPKTGETEGK